jgi:hypothetical protein
MSVTAWHAEDVHEVLQRLDSPRSGLSDAEAVRRLADVGPNRLTRTKPLSAARTAAEREWKHHRAHEQDQADEGAEGAFLEQQLGLSIPEHSKGRDPDRPTANRERTPPSLKRRRKRRAMTTDTGACSFFRDTSSGPAQLQLCSPSSARRERRWLRAPVPPRHQPPLPSAKHEREVER